jgi:hypothetical protein
MQYAGSKQEKRTEKLKSGSSAKSHAGRSVQRVSSKDFSELRG